MRRRTRRFFTGFLEILAAEPEERVVEALSKLSL